MDQNPFKSNLNPTSLPKQAHSVVKLQHQMSLPLTACAAFPPEASPPDLLKPPVLLFARAWPPPLPALCSPFKSTLPLWKWAVASCDGQRNHSITAFWHAQGNVFNMQCLSPSAVRSRCFLSEAERWLNWLGYTENLWQLSVAPVGHTAAGQ
eukprot:1157463-Pelagomonas_calceolata.AAC.2